MPTNAIGGSITRPASTRDRPPPPCADTFCWADLATDDPIRARSFYCNLFGWTAHDKPARGASSYTWLQYEGRSLAALYPMHPQQRAQGQSPHWLSYICVRRIETLSCNVTELGGRLEVPDFSPPAAGRMAVLRHDGGGTVALWEPAADPTARAPTIPPHAATTPWLEPRRWHALWTHDIGAAEHFYRHLFDWRAETVPNAADGLEHRVFMRGNTALASIVQIPKHANLPHSQWVVYFVVPECNTILERAKRLHAKVIMPPAPLPHGQQAMAAMLKDPRGAVFGLSSARSGAR